MAGDSSRTGKAVPEKPRTVSLMNEILMCINDQADIYHWKLVGDSPECILKLIECDDENLMNNILDLCGLYDSKKKLYTKGVPKFGLDNRRKGSLEARLSCKRFFLSIIHT
jgi:hypothetical protein